jgi:hypothetical protein
MNETMNETMCPRCQSGDIKLDEEETKLRRIITYYCDKCGLLIGLSGVGFKKPGWKTKKKIEDNNFIKAVPF